MKIDLEYVSKILSVFLESDKSHIDIKDIKKSGINIYDSTNRYGIDEKFLFHIQNIIENKFISNMQLENNGLKTVGIVFANKGSGIMPVPIRLTQKGHDFASVLNNEKVMKKLKLEFKDMPLEILIKAGKRILSNYANKKIDSMLN